MNQADKDLARKIEIDHKHLRESLDKLGSAFEQPASETGFVCWKLELLWQLRDFQNQLEKHFDLEEDGGYNRDLIRIAPHLAKQVHHLESDHRQIISDLNDILANLKSVENERSPVLIRVRERVETVVDFIRKHEAAEHAIIQEAYYQDYGVGD